MMNLQKIENYKEGKKEHLLSEEFRGKIMLKFGYWAKILTALLNVADLVAEVSRTLNPGYKSSELRG